MEKELKNSINIDNRDLIHSIRPPRNTGGNNSGDNKSTVKGVKNK